MFGIWLKQFEILDRRIGFSVGNCVSSRLETSVDLDLGRKMRKIRVAYLTLGGDNFGRRIVKASKALSNAFQKLSKAF